MSSQTTSQQQTESPNLRRFYIQLGILGLTYPILLFAAAGRLDWGMGWVFVVLQAGITIISRYAMIRANPGLLAERTGALNREDTKSWDKIIVPLVAISPLVQVVIAGLDFRYDWSPPFALWVEILGIALMLGFYLFTTWAMVTNAFFSSCVRLQTDREQKVIDTGPYAIVRHPGYLGLLAGIVFSALALSSLWALALGALDALLLVVRTALEDRTLRTELDGYEAYTGRVRFRLFPGIW